MTMTTAEAQAFCTDLTKKSGSNFYYSFSFCQNSAERHVYGVRLCKAWTAPSMSRQPEAIPRKNFAVGETSSSSSIAADRPAAHD